MKESARVSALDRGVIMMALSLPMLVLGFGAARSIVTLFTGL